MQLLLCKDSSLMYDFTNILKNSIIGIELRSGESPTGTLRVGDIVNYKYYTLNEKYGGHDVSVYPGRIIYLSRSAVTIDMSDKYESRVVTIEIEYLLQFILFTKACNVEGNSKLSNIPMDKYSENIEFKSGRNMVITNLNEVIRIGDYIEFYDADDGKQIGSGKLEKIELEDSNIAFYVDASDKYFSSHRKICVHGALSITFGEALKCEFNHIIIRRQANEESVSS